jgi:starvation-inducible DNA-binding protein
MVVKPSTTLDQNASEQIVQGLSQLLADTYIAYLKTQNFHWNVEDARFHSLHKLFEELYEQLADAVDEIAERIRALRLKSPGTMRQFLQLATLEEAEPDLTGDEMIHDLCHDREALAKHIRPKIEEAIKLGDEGTGDLLIQHLKMHEKAAWMLRSNLLETSN